MEKSKKVSAKPKLLAGDNPQIPKGEGDAPVQAWLAAIPGWKREVARRVDALAAKAVPDLRKAVKYNSPLYGAAGRDDWFMSQHCFTNYVKVAFFHGVALDPLPPGTSKQERVRYLDIREGDIIDEKTFVAWARQASRLSGERL
ncbi:DUF1801 domain-containing protein [Arenimonas sp.]|uniref:DUF1801 domain-containing protein n=1 Tax=Arenimonas sp. TaxID=1872635 RepID=UPI0039E654A7